MKRIIHRLEIKMLRGQTVSKNSKTVYILVTILACSFTFSAAFAQTSDESKLFSTENSMSSPCVLILT